MAKFAFKALLITGVVMAIGGSIFDDTRERMRRRINDRRYRP